ncbi:hypothetical protein F4802DRAFT_431605 [Xylaria palmicola]|nr:hypothetical protein F4802DRAFT_431605 [Xylaria palmicola]
MLAGSAQHNLTGARWKSVRPSLETKNNNRNSCPLPGKAKTQACLFVSLGAKMRSRVLETISGMRLVFASPHRYVDSEYRRKVRTTLSERRARGRHCDGCRRQRRCLRVEGRAPTGCETRASHPRQLMICARGETASSRKTSSDTVARTNNAADQIGTQALSMAEYEPEGGEKTRRESADGLVPNMGPVPSGMEITNVSPPRGYICEKPSGAYRTGSAAWIPSSRPVNQTRAHFSLPTRLGMDAISGDRETNGAGSVGTYEQMSCSFS